MLGRSSDLRFGQRANEFLEILRLPEVPVDAGKPHIGDLVERLQRVHHQLANLLAGDVALAARLQLTDQCPSHKGDTRG